MLISLERSGGFAGISKLMEIDTAKLPQKETEELCKLLESANFFNLPAYIEGNSKQRDRFQYTLTVEDKDKQHTVTVAESAIPENLRALIEWITDNS
ncbi:protealysin inhibitor emfourin [Calothrix sp. CCY 0018]|uniref:protealysin inhibitor emfourin n=1 Tax=Calothrix sp. CCY 0018 TaxID=3103864 RepID=UPI0039C6D961